MNNFYKARYAVDRNNATRWAPSSLPGYLIVDLGAEYPIQRCETTFELVMRTYRYRIEYLTQDGIQNITDAQNSKSWKMFADRSANTQNVSPVIDTNRVIARYLKLTLLSANLPTANAEISTILQTDFADRVSVFEFKVFPETNTAIMQNTGKNECNTFRMQNGKLSYSLTREGIVDLQIVNVSGRVVYNRSWRKPAGSWEFSPRDCKLTAGMYIVSLKTPQMQTKQIVSLLQ